jgi:predicted transcriptional regulator of viral defense system
MAKSRIQIARADIVQYFDQLPSKVLHHADLARILQQQRAFWRLTLRTTTRMFIDFLISSGKLSVFEFPFPKPYKKKRVYAWGPVPFYEVVLGISPKCYFSHYSAVGIHGLTEQMPKTIYINEEQRLESWLSGTLTQAGIDAAFRRPVRTTKRIANTNDYRVVFLNGRNTANLGVVKEEFNGAASKQFGRIRVTNIERTLIDITVRPVYSGGVSEVLKAFTLARERVSVNRLSAMLKKLAVIYPYHQAIGFYLERAGYRPSSVDLFRTTPRQFDFYLDHKLNEQEYVKEWRLFIPKWL